MSNLWDQFFDVQEPRQNQVLPVPIWTEHYPWTVEKPSWLANFKLVHIANLIRVPTAAEVEHEQDMKVRFLNFDDFSWSTLIPNVTTDESY